MRIGSYQTFCFILFIALCVHIPKKRHWNHCIPEASTGASCSERSARPFIKPLVLSIDFYRKDLCWKMKNACKSHDEDKRLEERQKHARKKRDIKKGEKCVCVCACAQFFSRLWDNAYEWEWEWEHMNVPYLYTYSCMRLFRTHVIRRLI